MEVSTLWTTEEHVLFTGASSCAGSGDYRGMLRLAEELLELVHGNSAKTAYTLGCRKAVALRHLGRTRHAEAAFKEAYEMVLAANQLAIASYIRNDWASMLPADKAIARIDQAIKLRKQAESTPDPGRSLSPDVAYFEAHKARMLARQGKISEAASLIAATKKTLKLYARHRAYQNAYLVVLVWELEIHKRSSLQLLLLAPSVLLGIARQGKLLDAIKLLRSKERRQVNVPKG